MIWPYFENASSISSAEASCGSWRTRSETPTPFLPLSLSNLPPPRPPPPPRPRGDRERRASPSLRGDRERLRLADLAGRGERSSPESPPSRVGGDCERDLSSPRGDLSPEGAGEPSRAGASSPLSESASRMRALSSSSLILALGRRLTVRIDRPEPSRFAPIAKNSKITRFTTVCPVRWAP